MGQNGFPHNVSQDLMFQTSAQSDKGIQGYRSAKVGYRNEVLIVTRVNVLYRFLRVMNHLVGDP